MADAYRLSGLGQTEIRRSQEMSEKGVRWFAGLGAAVIKTIKYFLRTRYPDEDRAQSALEEAGSIAAATENAVKSFAAPVTAGVKGADTSIDSAASPVIDLEEIQRRRDLVRTMFNDFWSGAYEKPTTFVERLDQAENYVNERLGKTGEFWQLDAKTRVTLGLPPRSHRRTN